jgi:predicted dehydrogenase
MRKAKILIIGAGDRGNAYANYSLQNPGELQVAGIAEPDRERRGRFCKKYNIDDKYAFKDWKDALKKEKFADAAIITTQDRMHFGPATGFLRKGYNVLVEKPMATTPEECTKMVSASKKQNTMFGVCHVLRYTPFYRKIKEIIDSSVIGDIATIEHIESVQYWHQAHSFVRGNWRNSNTSSPMILAKSCHDMDILRWLIDKPCRKVSSFGSLLHFKKENAPRGSTERCTGGCRVEKECPYSAMKLYLDPKRTGWPVSVISADLSMQGRIKALKEGPYGRCVYRCDNNVVDHQVVSLEFEGGITASFTMTAFTSTGKDRRTRIMGTKGEIICEPPLIEVNTFKDNKTKTYDTADNASPGSGHGGGDYGIMRDFTRALRENNPAYLSSSIEVSLESHLMAFAAEESRIKNKVVFL